MTATEVETPRTDKAQRDQRAGRLLPAAVAVGGLWLAMALSSLFGAAFPARDRMARWALPVAGLGIWGAVALVSIFAPTIVPVAGLFAPGRRGYRDGVRVPGGRLGGRVGAARLSVPAPRRPSVEHQKV